MDQVTPVYKPPVTSTAIFPSPTLHFLAVLHTRPNSGQSPVCARSAPVTLAFFECLELSGALPRHLAFPFLLLSLPRTPCPVSSSPHFHHPSWPTELLFILPSSAQPDCPDSKCPGLCCHAILWLPFGRGQILWGHLSM